MDVIRVINDLTLGTFVGQHFSDLLSTCTGKMVGAGFSLRINVFKS